MIFANDSNLKTVNSGHFSSLSKESHTLEGHSNVEVKEIKQGAQKTRKWVALTQGRKVTEYLMSII